MRNTPKVSVGMPVFNGEKYIGEAINSILSQTFADFELIISDNASLDKTEEICLSFAKRDSRISYVRQVSNLGAMANFVYVLSAAKGPYFMWAAADDKRSPDFIEHNLMFLEQNPDYVASTSPVHFQGAFPNEIAMGDASLESDNLDSRVVNFFRKWHANGRFYSLIRKAVLDDFPYKQEKYLGFDWTWVIFLAKQGRLKRIQRGWVQLGVQGESNTSNVFSSYRTTSVEWILPFWKLSRRVLGILKDQGLLVRLQIIIRLIKLNVTAFLLQARWLIQGYR